MQARFLMVMVLLVAWWANAASADPATMAAAFGMDEAVMQASGDAAPVAVEAFAQGTWTVQGYGSSTFAAPEGELYNGHVGVGYHLLDGLSLNAEVLIGAIDADREGTLFFGGLEFLLRYHFWRERDWSLFADGSVGFMYASDEFPGGSDYNFRSSAGLGATIRVIGDARVIGGARFIHISNAGGKSLENPAYDALTVYAGLIVPF